MLGYRKRQFSQAYSLLHNLRRDPNDLVALKQIQLLLLREIMRAETKIRELKGELRTLSDSSDEQSERRTALLQRQLECEFRRNPATDSELKPAGVPI
jgi:hypothetical protein